MMIEPIAPDQLDRLLDAYPRGWFIHYWEEVCLELRDWSYPAKVEAFFYLVERLLDEGKVKFADPHGDGSTLWDAAPDVVVEHLRSGWPKDADTEGSPLIVSYFYDDWNRCPPIFWLGPDGQWHGS
jgi:hypothetical protein